MLENLKSSKSLYNLKTPLQYIKGVGPRLAEKFKQKKINTIEDLLYFYPRTYRDQRLVDDIKQLSPGQYAVVQGEVFHKKIQRRFKGKKLYIIVLRTNKNAFFSIKYFKLPFKGFFDSMEIGQKLKIGGWVYFYNKEPEFHHPEFYQECEKVLPVYSEIEGVSQRKIRQIIHAIFEKISIPDLHENNLPNWIRRDFDLMTSVESLKDIHQPQYSPELYLKYQAPSQKTLIFEEFFKLQLDLALKKLKLKKNLSHPMQCEGQLVSKLKSLIPFHLTSAQVRVFNEIKKDLEQPYPMQRLIQGDVGSGKTLVAFQACLHAFESGFQSALMSPTEILSEQHFKNAKILLEPLNVNVQLLTSKIKNKKILDQIKQGVVDLCIGTHALIQDQVEFNKLGLVIIDEQHRFGVHQRQRLFQKSSFFPHYLVMTATPIPRTLAMALYGDLDISIIDELPQGRPPILTKKTKKRKDVFLFLEREVLKGRQAYVVYPLVEESENIDLKNAIEQFEKLKQVFPLIRWGLLHGRMSFDEKSQIMSKFIKNEIQVLVTTTVVEVGMDVPNATVMIVEHSERFGLSQLHQLRGRIGRSVHKSYCILIYENKISKESLIRLKAMENIKDGFHLSEEDLKLRGAGEFLGVRQSGFMHFKLAHLIRDIEIQKQAKRAVQIFIDKDPYFKKKNHQNLKIQMQEISKIRQS